DLLVCTPTLKAIRETHKNRKIIVYCSTRIHREVLLNNPHVDSVRVLGAKYMWRYPYHLFVYLFDRSRIKYYYLNFQHVSPTYIYNKNMTEVVPDIFADLGITLSDNRIQLFFTEAEEEKARKVISAFKNPIFMHVHSTSSPNHIWPIENWEALVRKTPEF